MKRNFLLLTISFALVYIFSNIEIVRGDNESLQENIASKIIRFHVIANSDSNEDQELKLKVKDSVIEYTKTLLKDSGSLDETYSLIKDNENKIIEIARETIKENGYDYDISLDYENCYFPAKTYGDITFPPGNYNAFKINIGKSEGKNWWCVLYPPLCFVDAIHAVVPEDSKKQLEDILGYHDYKALIYGTNSSEKNYKIEFKFKFLTFLN